MPIGNPTTNFTGTFDGLGHTISNLTINRPGTDYVGLFGAAGTGSTIRNVGLVGGSVSGLMYVGGLVAENRGTISNSYATGSVSGSYGGAGGLVAYNSSTISNSYATGSVSGRGYLGGLVGVNGDATISNSYATGSVSGPVDLIGGLAGYNFGTISNSYATGSVSGGDHVGGLVGRNTYGRISTSYATGSVSGSGTVGGLVGINLSGAISNSYWNTSDNISGRWGVGNDQTNSNATGLTSAQMLQKSNFAGFDFTVTPVWGGNAAINSGYPILCAFGACITTTSVYAVPLTGFSLYGSTPVFTYGLVDVNGSAFTLSNASMGGTATNSSGAPTAFSNAGSYSFSYLSGLGLTGTGASNYVLAPYSASVVWRVDKAPLTVSANSQNRLYGAANPAFTQTVSGFVNSETLATSGVSGTAIGSSTADARTNVGTASITASASGLSASNYDFTTLSNGTLTIGKAHLTVSADNQNRLYGVANPTFTQTVSGFVNNETLATSGVSGTATGSSTSIASTNVGTASIVASASGLSASNYAFTNLVDGTLTINPAALTVVSATLPATALNAMAQLQSGVLSNRMNNEPQTLSLSPTPTVTQSAGTGSAASASESGSPAAGGTRTTVNTIVINIGAAGTTLQIVSGGMRLPDTMTMANEK